MSLVTRNIRLYFRDKPAVIMSLLAEVIIMILYIMFIRDNLLSSFQSINNIEEIIDAWMIGGILGITPVTATMGAYGVMVEDRIKHIINDFRTSPLSTSSITLGYTVSASFVGIVMSVMVLLIGEGYMFVKYGNIAAAGNVIYVFAMIILNSLCISALVILPIIFVNTNNSLAGSCTIIGALIGFLTGIYLPMGTMGSVAQAVVRNFPISHGVAVFRQLLTENSINKTTELTGDICSEFKEYMGIVLFKEGIAISPLNDVLLLAVCAVICMILTIIIRGFLR